MTNEDLTENQTPEEAAAEDAAFAAAFNEQRGQSEEPAVEPVEPAVEPAVEPVEPVEPVAEQEPQAETPKAVLAGLTEEQITQALARVSQQQMTIDKLGGRIGQLMQQVEKLKDQPRTAAEQRSFDLKLEKLGQTFPELAEILREDLKSISVAPVAEQPAQQTFTAEDVDRIVSEKLGTFKVQQERALEVKVLGSVHPDWEQVIRTPQFALWRDNVIADGKELMESENAAYISRKLTEFKDWVKATTSPTHQPAPTPASSTTNKDRLRQAVMPVGAQVQSTGPVTEEDAFAAAFAKERARGGR